MSSCGPGFSTKDHGSFNVIEWGGTPQQYNTARSAGIIYAADGYKCSWTRKKSKTRDAYEYVTIVRHDEKGYSWEIKGGWKGGDKVETGAHRRPQVSFLTLELEAAISDGGGGSGRAGIEVNDGTL